MKNQPPAAQLRPEHEWRIVEMKRMLSAALAILLLFPLVACGASEQQEAPETAGSGTAAAGQAPNANAAQADNVLVAYFSWADNAVLADDVDAVSSLSVLAPGNVEQLAGWVQEETGGDLFSIRVTEPYPSDWDACLERANQERGEDTRPELAETVENFDQYDTVFLGYPNWWYGVPMALLSFVEQHDLSGKQVYLFCSHGTGGLARSVDILTEAMPDAAISEHVFDCYEQDAASSQQAIQDWVRELGLTAQESPADARQIAVQFDGGSVICQLNDSAAAQALRAQLPFTAEVEDYGNNEKIFYPPEQLDTSDAPLAQAGAGTVAYYAPWGDVVLFYGDYSENAALFSLGEIVSGGEMVPELTGTVTITELPAQ